MTDSREVTSYRGRDLKDLSKEELIEAIQLLNRMLQGAREEIVELAKLVANRS